MAKIETLVDDIQHLLTHPRGFSPAGLEAFNKSLVTRVSNKLSEERQPPSLRMSNLGMPRRKLWYTINQPERGEHLPADVIFKFLYGDIIEALLLFLAREAGHEVTDEQMEVNLYGVSGHIDGRIDGHLVDVKSASTYSFHKFKQHGLEADDPFGYLIQLYSYGNCLGDDRASFLVADKTLGHIHRDEWPVPKIDFQTLIEDRREMLACKTPPPRCYDDELFQRSGNRKLGIGCSYCPFKFFCWPGLRLIPYAGRPVFLTKVVREPKLDSKK